MTPVNVIKKNLVGQETWHYSGEILRKGLNWVVIEAFFNRPDTPFHDIMLKKGDRFIETYYTDRWYNIFEMYDRETGALKGWYCNITYPAEIGPGRISYVDLALDLLVYPNGNQLVLDEDEFEALALSPQDRAHALAALDDLRYVELPGQG